MPETTAPPTRPLPIASVMASINRLLENAEAEEEIAIRVRREKDGFTVSVDYK